MAENTNWCFRSGSNDQSSSENQSDCRQIQLLLIYTQHFSRYSSHFILRQKQIQLTQQLTIQCLDEAKEEKVLEKEELNDTERSCEITSKALLSQLSDDLLDEVVWSESADSSTKRPEVFSRTTWKVWSGMQSLTLSTQRGRQLLLWTSSTLSSDKARPSTDSVVKQLNYQWRSIITAC